MRCDDEADRNWLPGSILSDYKDRGRPCELGSCLTSGIRLQVKSMSPALSELVVLRLLFSMGLNRSVNMCLLNTYHVPKYLPHRVLGWQWQGEVRYRLQPQSDAGCGEETLLGDGEGLACHLATPGRWQSPCTLPWTLGQPGFSSVDFHKPLTSHWAQWSLDVSCV